MRFACAGPGPSTAHCLTRKCLLTIVPNKDNAASSPTVMIPSPWIALSMPFCGCQKTYQQTFERLNPSEAKVVATFSPQRNDALRVT